MGIDSNAKDILQALPNETLDKIAAARGIVDTDAMLVRINGAWAPKLPSETMRMEQYAAARANDDFIPDVVMGDMELLVQASLSEQQTAESIAASINRWIDTSFRWGAHTVKIYGDIRQRVPLAKRPTQDARTAAMRRTADGSVARPFSAEEIADKHLESRVVDYGAEGPPLELATGHWARDEERGGWIRVRRENFEWIYERCGVTHIGPDTPLPEPERLRRTPAVMNRLQCAVAAQIVSKEVGVAYHRTVGAEALRRPRVLVLDGVPRPMHCEDGSTRMVPHRIRVQDFRPGDQPGTFTRLPPEEARVAEVVGPTEAGEADIRIQEEAVRHAEAGDSVLVRMWDSDLLPLLLLRIVEPMEALVVLDMRIPRDMTTPNEKYSRIVCPIALRVGLTQYMARVFPRVPQEVATEVVCALLVMGGNDFSASVPGSKLKTVLDTLTFCEDDLAAMATVEEAPEPFAGRRRIRINEPRAASLYGRLYTRYACGKARALKGVASRQEMARCMANKISRSQRKKNPAIADDALDAIIEKTTRDDLGAEGRLRADARRLQWWFDYAMLGGSGRFIRPQESVQMSENGKSIYGWMQDTATKKVTRTDIVE